MVEPDADEVGRVRDYLLAQGEKYSWLDLWPRVIAGRLDFLDAISDVNSEQAAFQPGGDVWSIAEVGHHVLQASRNVQKVVRSLSAGGAAPAGNVDPPREPARTPWDSLSHSIREDSVRLAALIDGLPEPPSLDAVSPHPFFGDLHARAWYLFQRVHDQDHAQQVLANKSIDAYPS